MKYQINIRKVRGIQNEIWGSIRRTFNFRKGFGAPLPIFGHYGGVFRCGKDLLVIHTDGVGTKLLVAQALNRYDTVGIDAIAMSVNDILCLGAESLVGVDYIALAKEDNRLVAELMKGLINGAEESNCAIIGGETAIVPDLLHDKKTFDLTFTVVGRIRKKMITGDAIRPGDILIGLESSGIHSNGYTLARKLLDSKKWGKEMLIPTRIYVRPVLQMIASAEIHGIAHITGGAFSKLTRLNKKYGFMLDNMPKPPPIFRALSRESKREELYRVFNMGIGMVLAVKPKDSDLILQIAKRYRLPAHQIGEVIAEQGVFLDSRKIRLDISEG